MFSFSRSSQSPYLVDEVDDHIAQTNEVFRNLTAKSRRDENSRNEKIAAAEMFLSTEFSDLAAALKNALQNFDIRAADANAQIDDAERRLLLGQRLVLTQSEAMWGENITSIALRGIGLNPHSIREKIERILR